MRRNMCLLCLLSAILAGCVVCSESRRAEWIKSVFPSSRRVAEKTPMPGAGVNPTSALGGGAVAMMEGDGFGLRAVALPSDDPSEPAVIIGIETHVVPRHACTSTLWQRCAREQAGPDCEPCDLDHDGVVGMGDWGAVQVWRSEHERIEFHPKGTQLSITSGRME